MRACRFVARHQRVDASERMGRRGWPSATLRQCSRRSSTRLRIVTTRFARPRFAVRVFSDRIELHSPGELLDSMRVADLSRERSVRNRAIASLLAGCLVPECIESLRSTLMARKGDGVPAIVALSRSPSGKEPAYELFGNELRLPIYAAGPAAGGSI